MRGHLSKNLAPISGLLAVILIFTISIALYLIRVGMREMLASVQGHVRGEAQDKSTMGMACPRTPAPTTPQNSLPSEVELAEQWEQKLVGYVHRRSSIYKAFQEYAAHAPREELLRLVRHPNPVVRVYVGGHIIANLPKDAAALYSLLGDTESVKQVIYDVIMPVSINRVIASGLCDIAREAAVQEILLRAATDRSLRTVVRASALRCMMSQRPQEAIPIAHTFLQNPDSEIRAGGVWAFAGIDSEDSFAIFAAHAKDTSPEIRRAVAVGLGKSLKPDALVLLRKLLQDSDRFVQEYATAGCAYHAAHASQLVWQLLTDQRWMIRRSAVLALAENPTITNLRLLRRYFALRRDPFDSPEIIARLAHHSSPTVAAFVRTILSEMAPRQREEMKHYFEIERQLELEAR